jgi:hypothetical protein
VEHPATINPCRFLEKLGESVTVLPVDRYGMKTERTANSVQTTAFFGDLDRLRSTGNASDWHDQTARRNYPQLRKRMI